MEIEERNKKFYTEEGMNALRERMKSLTDFYNKNKFPVNEFILGFGKISIPDKSHCLERIKELSVLIGQSFKIKKIETDKGNINEEIVWQ